MPQGLRAVMNCPKPSLGNVERNGFSPRVSCRCKTAALSTVLPCRHTSAMLGVALHCTAADLSLSGQRKSGCPQGRRAATCRCACAMHDPLCERSKSSFGSTLPLQSTSSAHAQCRRIAVAGVEDSVVRSALLACKCRCEQRAHAGIGLRARDSAAVPPLCVHRAGMRAGRTSST